jgi:hypothetical protein
MRYSAQSERLYRRTIADFDRIRALSGAGLLACLLPPDHSPPGRQARRPIGANLTIKT